MGTAPVKRDEGEFSGVGEFADADLTAAGEQFHFSRPVHGADSFGFDERRFPDPFAGLATLGFADSRGGGHPVDGHQSEFAHEMLVVFTAQRGVVDNCLGAGEVRTMTGEHVDCLCGLAAGCWYERCVKNDPRVLLQVTCCNDHELASPCGLTGGLVDELLTPLCLEQRSDHLAVGIQRTTQVRMCPRTRTRGIAQAERERACRAATSRWAALNSARMRL